MIAPDRVWRQPPVNLNLPDDTVHIWQMALEQPPDRVASLARLLSPDEQIRSDRFHFEHDRRRFMVSHSGLRQILGRYLNLAPHTVRFTNGPCGKPYLAEELRNSELQFNLTHSGELALCAVTKKNEVGIDLEQVRPLPDFMQIAARYFSAAEYLALCDLPEHQQLEGFFSGWTRKEAYLKATGAGLAQRLDQIQVTIKPDERPQILMIDSPVSVPTRWSIISLAPASQYSAAVVIGGPNEDDENDHTLVDESRMQLYSWRSEGY